MTFTFTSRPNVGQQPNSQALKLLLSEAVREQRHLARDHVIVHHYTDRKDGLQLEVEFRTTDPAVPLMKRCRFERIIL